MPALCPSPERVPEDHPHFPIRRTRFDVTVIVCPTSDDRIEQPDQILLFRGSIRTNLATHLFQEGVHILLGGCNQEFAAIPAQVLPQGSRSLLRYQHVNILTADQKASIITNVLFISFLKAFINRINHIVSRTHGEHMNFNRATWLVLVVYYGAILVGAPFLHATVTWDPNTNSFVYHHQDANGNTDYYSYAPSVIIDGSTEYVYTCHNSNADQIVDNIWLTEFNRSTGQVIFDQSVLQPTPGSWDSAHTCDPSVLKSNVNLNGNPYSYVMFYLGTDQTDDNHNQIGVAFANSPEGPWTKFTGHVVGYDMVQSSPGCYINSTYSCWGVGQPSATSVDGNGRILLFWRGSNTGAFRGDINIGNITDTGQWPVWNSYIAVTTSGLTDAHGESDSLIDYDVAYDWTRDRFYAVREQRDNSIPYCSPTNPTFICQSLQVNSIAASSIWSGGGSWSVEAVIDPTLTGNPRNHNAGIARNWDGTISDPSKVTVMYTVACADSTNIPCNGTYPVWTYSLWQVSGSIQ
jgi:hypothetical protein